jgi:hypothetical protein
MSINVTVEDTETGESQTSTISNDVVVIVAGTAHVAHIANYPSTGTQIYTIKGLRPNPTTQTISVTTEEPN